MRRARRCKGDLVLIEGPHLLREALAIGMVPEAMLATPDFLASTDGRALMAGLPQPPLAAEARLLEELADSDSPRGIVATIRRPATGLEALPVRASGTYIYLDGIQDPGNLGAIARVAEAAGATGLALATGCAHPNHPRALRASAGSLLRLPVAHRVDSEVLDAHLVGGDAGDDAGGTDHAPTWVALDAGADQSLYEATLDGCVILALGAEGPGLSATTRAHTGRALHIPMVPPVESLNVATAAAVVLFELARRRAGPATPSAGKAGG